MVYVIKVKCGDVLRRFTFESTPREEDLSFSGLESRIRRLFELPAEKQIRVTYNDQDNDVITMADDQDLVDALIMQSLNPLRLCVTPTEPESMALDVVPTAQLASLIVESKSMALDAAPQVLPAASAATGLEQPESEKEATRDILLHNLKGEFVKGLTAFHEGGTSFSQEFVERIVNVIATQVSAAVKGVEVNARSVGEVLAGLPVAKAVSNTAIAAFPLPRPSEASSASKTRSEGHEAAEPKSVNRVFHGGVTCDACGEFPIEGTRFKSKKRHDYDLCTNCFNKGVDKADYTRIERPLYRPRHLHSPGNGRMRCPAVYGNHYQGRHMSMSGPYTSRASDRWHQGPIPQVAGGGTLYAGKLDSRFVEDVTIMDGTEIAAGTRFTKIWRLRNSGKIPWAPQTKLVHVGGDELGSVLVVPLELSGQGLLPEQEVEAAVDLVAPEKPGRYVSHWRLASPAGSKFGHRVWVVIQVLPNDIPTSVGLEIADSDADKFLDDCSTERTPLLSQTASLNSREDFVKGSHAATKQAEGGKITYPEVDMARSFADVLDPFSGLKMFNNMEREAEVGEESLVTVPEVKVGSLTEVVVQGEVAVVENSELGGGFSMVEMPPSGNNLVSSVAFTPRGKVEVPLVSKQDEKVEVGQEESIEVELSAPERISLKLEAMGFSDRKLNVELLKRNELDLRRTLDDLFAAAEWDPILEELEEMGFYDTEMNRRLMFKNNGSVKRVVKELVQLYKGPDDQGKRKGVVVE